MIPLNARIFTLVDVFDALTSKRPYKDPIPFDKAMEIMSADSGTHFDPELFQVFHEAAVEIYENLAGVSEADLTEKLHSLMRIYYGSEALPKK
jgi:HD-GYP domain-containing protein (c-di-GMP phosphodiesterase class II)